ncbi:hypothetical protein LZG74_19910 [Dyadobacter sp. CY327]|uniref:hypothetical protein n=1 Tax=Dyadobacter sp. CY327 TaxID=2907301 RepID=UPI001F2CEEC8|nr:hypothetical protein [Dyadobacter sp. CY327]MCE7072591.1 hypothetical protein [Dyadobacter sp. CY327]
MKNKILLFSLITVLSLLAFSCKRDDSLPVIEPGQSTRLEKITSGNENVQLFKYNDRGLVSAVTVHWVYPDSPGTIGNLIATVEYDSSNRIEKIRNNGKMQVRFTYRGNTLDKTEEYDYKNRLVVSHQYFFTNNGRLSQILDMVHAGNNQDGAGLTKHVYEYDQHGNVRMITTLTRQNENKPFTSTLQVQYDDYDDKINSDPSFVFYPFVKGTVIQKNNPGKITVRDLKTQSVLSVQKNKFIYDNQGFVLQESQRYSGSEVNRDVLLDYHYIPTQLR